MLIKRVVKICVVALALVGFTACSSTSEKTTEAGLESTTPSTEEVTEGTDTEVTTPDKKASVKKGLKGKKALKGKKGAKGKKGTK